MARRSRPSKTRHNVSVRSFHGRGVQCDARARSSGLMPRICAGVVNRCGLRAKRPIARTVNFAGTVRADRRHRRNRRSPGPRAAHGDERFALRRAARRGDARVWLPDADDPRCRGNEHASRVPAGAPSRGLRDADGSAVATAGAIGSQRRCAGRDVRTGGRIARYRLRTQTYAGRPSWLSGCARNLRDGAERRTSRDRRVLRRRRRRIRLPTRRLFL